MLLASAFKLLLMSPATTTRWRSAVSSRAPSTTSRRHAVLRQFDAGYCRHRCASSRLVTVDCVTRVIGCHATFYSVTHLHVTVCLCLWNLMLTGRRAGHVAPPQRCRGDAGDSDRAQVASRRRPRPDSDRRQQGPTEHQSFTQLLDTVVGQLDGVVLMVCYCVPWSTSLCPFVAKMWNEAV